MPDGTLVECATGPYNSAIELWLSQNQLSANQSIDLFQSEIMALLGYHELWTMSIDHLRLDFNGFPYLDYRDLIDPLRPSGCFTHTVNHSKNSADDRMNRHFTPPAPGTYNQQIRMIVAHGFSALLTFLS